ncbi:MAG: sensor histidine kinase [Dehalococcoidales bacterium]|nr:sensor histidine kinase [Dehalococcoidales bacterium]
MWLFRKPDKRMFLNWRGYLSGIVLVALITWLLSITPPTIIPGAIASPYMLAIVPVATYFGLGPAVFTSILSVVVYDFFLLSPVFIFTLIEPGNLGILFIFLFVGIVISFIASGLRSKIEETKRLSIELIKSQEEERKRMARELHDDTSPSLALIGLELDNILRVKSPLLPEEVIQKLKDSRERIGDIHQHIRQYSHELHPAILDNLGLESALEALVDELNSKTGIVMEFEVKGTTRNLPDEIKLELYRIAQEALNNIWKHSQAAKAVVKLEYSPHKTILSIIDNGRGYDTSEKYISLGITNMKDRASLIGAEIKIDSAIGRGTAVFVELSA